MFKFNKEELFRALLKTMLLGATTHLIILVYYAFTHQSFGLLNAFNILDLDLYFPQLNEGAINFVVSYFMLFCVYVLVLYSSKKPRRDV